METIRVRKANSILVVPAVDRSSYLAKGYDVLGENGSIVEECIPTDIPTLQAKYLELTEENKKLRAELENLKNSKPAKTVKAPVEEPKADVVEEPVKEPVEDKVVKKTRTRTKKQ